MKFFTIKQADGDLYLTRGGKFAEYDMAVTRAFPMEQEAREFIHHNPQLNGIVEEKHYGQDQAPEAPKAPTNWRDAAKVVFAAYNERNNINKKGVASAEETEKAVAAASAEIERYGRLLDQAKDAYSKAREAQIEEREEFRNILSVMDSKLQDALQKFNTFVENEAVPDVIIDDNAVLVYNEGLYQLTTAERVNDE